MAKSDWIIYYSPQEVLGEVAGDGAVYHPNYYGAFVFDPGGHSIETVCHKPDWNLERSMNERGGVMNKPVINIEEVELQPRPAAFAPRGEAAERFDARIGQIAPLIGAHQLGYNLTAVPPGRRAFPFHNHRVNEEMFFILEGSGELRYGEETYPLRPGDVIACPAGDRSRAHSMLNTGDGELRYLAVSTKLNPEIAEYPDSGKFGVLAQFDDEPGGQPRMFYHIAREGEGLDYWEGE